MALLAALRFNGVVRPSSLLLALASSSILACLPPAIVELSEPAAAPEATTPAPVDRGPAFALLPWGATLYARPDFSAPSLALDAGPDVDAGVEGRVVEILDRSEKGWWLVRTMEPRQAAAYGFAAAAGLEVFVFTGWTPQLPQRETRAPSKTKPTRSLEPSTAHGRVEQLASPRLSIEAGEVIYWPDDSAAGEVIHPHAFYSAWTPGEGAEMFAPYALVCYSSRSSAGIGAIVGQLCYRVGGDPASPEDEARPPIAMDTAPSRPVRQGQATVQGALDKDIIRRIVRAHINEVRGCYNAGLSSDPTLGGRVTVQFEISSTGRVASARVTQDELSAPSVSACIAAAVKRWKFPKPRGGGKVTVSYPFVLTAP